MRKVSSQKRIIICRIIENFFVKMRDAEPDKYIKCYMYGNCSGIIGAALAYGKIFKNIDQEWKTDNGTKELWTF